MSRHVVVGAGSVGTATALRLAARGDEVTLVSRSGRGPDNDRIERVAADAADAEALAKAAAGAVALYNCVNPPSYDLWPRMWPPVAAGLLAAAESSGAVLTTLGNLYPYGPVDGPMREGMPDRGTGTKARVRAAITTEALARHRAGRIRAVEVRSSDFLGADPAQSHVDRALDRALAGRPVRMVGAVDQPHSWTWVEDVAAALVTAAADEALWGRVWHVPTNAPRSQRETIADHCRAAGIDPVPVRVVPHLALRVIGVFDKHLAGLEEIRYQFVRPYVLDSAESEAALGFGPTPWDEICRRNVARHRAA